MRTSNSNLSQKSKIRPGSISIDEDSSDPVFEIQCTIETSTYDEEGDCIRKETKEMTKLYPVDQFMPRDESDISNQASTLIASCKYLSKSQREIVENLLHRLYLKENQFKSSSSASDNKNKNKSRQSRDYRDNDNNSNNDNDGSGRDRRNKYDSTSGDYESKKSSRDKMKGNIKNGNGSTSSNSNYQLEKNNEQQLAAIAASVNKVDWKRLEKTPVHMDHLEDYIELLYEGKDKDDMSEKIKGTFMILKLFRDLDNIDDLINNDTMMHALTRVLEDEHRKSMDLTFNIVRIFLAMSNYSEMHAKLSSQYKIGSLTLKVIEKELQRAEHWKTEYSTNNNNNSNDSSNDGGINNESKRDENSNNSAVFSPRNRNYHQNNSYKMLISKQDKLLFVCFYVLLQLAEGDVNVEKKMIRKKLLDHLSMLLKERLSFDLILCILTFLQKLSPFIENVEVLIKYNNIIPRLIFLLTLHQHVDPQIAQEKKVLQEYTYHSKYGTSNHHHSYGYSGSNSNNGGNSSSILAITSKTNIKSEKELEDLREKHEKYFDQINSVIEASLKLLFNLSFHKDGREMMLAMQIIPKLVDLLNESKFRGRVLKILYHLSSEDKCKQIITYTDCIPILREFIISFPRPMIPIELAAVMVNFTWNDRNCELLTTKGGIRKLIERGINNRDHLLLKIIRNISIYTHNVQLENITRDEEYNPLPHLLRSLWGHHVIPLIRLLLDNDSTNEVVLETFGILSNLTIYDLDTVRLTWFQICKDFPLLDFCQRLLLPGMAQPDIMLEVVIFLGQISLDVSLGPLFASSKILQSLESVLADGLNTNHVGSSGILNPRYHTGGGGGRYHSNEIAEFYENSDPELILQTLFTLYRFLRLEETAAIMLQYTQLTLEIMDVLKHPNIEVQYMADQVLGTLLELDRKIYTKHDEEKEAGESHNTSILSSSIRHENFGVLGQRICRKRFEAHNREWFENCEKEDKEHRMNNDYPSSSTSTSSPHGKFGHAKFYSNDDDFDGDTDSSFEREHILNGLQASSYTNYLNQSHPSSTTNNTNANRRSMINSQNSPLAYMKEKNRYHSRDDESVDGESGFPEDVHEMYMQLGTQMMNQYSNLDHGDGKEQDDEHNWRGEEKGY